MLLFSVMLGVNAVYSVIWFHGFVKLLFFQDRGYEITGIVEFELSCWAGFGLNKQVCRALVEL